MVCEPVIMNSSTCPVSLHVPSASSLGSADGGLDLPRHLDGRRQVLASIFCDEHVVLDSEMRSGSVSTHCIRTTTIERRKCGGSPDTADVPVFVEYVLVNILAVLWIVQVRLDHELAKVDLHQSVPCPIKS
jgi:hypothetical protein